jgi:hypothetical protein
MVFKSNGHGVRVDTVFESNGRGVTVCYSVV